nr:hypothetical protein [Candidatus Njordarchaeota archaeon]
MLAIAHVEAYQATRKPEDADVVEDLISVVLRDLSSPDGVSYSAIDADSEK